MREIVRSENNFKHQQFGAIDWNTENPFEYTITVFNNSNDLNQMIFNENIESLYKKWLVGETVEFTIPSTNYNWNIKENFIPTVFGIAEKNEYVARKAQKLIQLYYCTNQTALFETEIRNIENKIAETTAIENQNVLFDECKTLNEKIKIAVAKTKNITLEQKWVEDGIFNENFLALQPRINEIFEKLKHVKAAEFNINYNTIAPKVEAAYIQAKTDENFGDTRKEMIALQKEVIATPLERWQKNELMDRLGAAFDSINARQDEWRLQQDTKRAVQTEELQTEYETIIPKALESNFNDAFTMLKNLQETTNKSSILREKRDDFYKALDEAFTTIKQKADTESEANYALASKQIEVAILASNNTDLFKDARAILIDAQNDLKEIRLGKTQKDELFGKLREAFDKLNAEQDAYFVKRKSENKNKLEDLVQNLKRTLQRRKEGMESLYNAKSNIEAKASVIKVDKKSDGTIANMFTERLVEITAKVAGAEKDIADLEKKIEKIEKELTEIPKGNE
jgi:hypothetical protein